jgi:hypothetical protein
MTNVKGKTCAICAGEEHLWLSIQNSLWDELVFCDRCSIKRIPIPFPCLFPDLEFAFNNRTGANPVMVKEYREYWHELIVINE